MSEDEEIVNIISVKVVKSGIVEYPNKKLKWLYIQDRDKPTNRYVITIQYDADTEEHKDAEYFLKNPVVKIHPDLFE